MQHFYLTILSFIMLCTSQGLLADVRSEAHTIPPDVKDEVLSYFAQEPFPSNSLPVEVLEHDEATYLHGLSLPPITETQTYEQEVYGIRLFDSEEALLDILEPGDIQMNFFLLNPMSSPERILQGGQYHMALVVANKEITEGKKIFENEENKKFCHVESPPHISNCVFSYASHYFRMIEVQKDQNELIALQALELYKNNLYEYDEYLSLNIPEDCEAVDEKFFKARANINKIKLYCSELPFILYTHVNKANLFDIQKPSQIIHEFKTSPQRSNFIFSFNDLNITKTEDTSRETVKELAKRYATNYLLKYIPLLFYEGYSSNALVSGLDHYTGGVILPSAYMKEAKKLSHKTLVYLGTYVDLSKRKQRMFHLGSGKFFLKGDRNSLSAYDSNILYMRRVFSEKKDDSRRYIYKKWRKDRSEIDAVGYSLVTEKVFNYDTDYGNGKEYDLAIIRISSDKKSNDPYKLSAQVKRKYKHKVELKDPLMEYTSTSVIQNKDRKMECMNIAAKSKNVNAPLYKNIETFCIYLDGKIQVFPGQNFLQISDDNRLALNSMKRSYNPQTSSYDVTEYSVIDLNDVREIYKFNNSSNRYKILRFKDADNIFVYDTVDSSIKMLNFQKGCISETYLNFKDNTEFKDNEDFVLFPNMRVYAHIVDGENCSRCDIEIRTVETEDLLQKINVGAKITGLIVDHDEEYLYYLDDHGELVKRSLFTNL